ncbi:stomatin/Mec-2 family protein [mine drainage metagenome]|uniref:Stomatin/Mec-2 family protein n=1 Tax=mine drainage metagenome TaxID=410659 RepID=T1A910_9ZZZZ
MSIIIIVIIVLALLLVAGGVRIVPQQRSWIVERMGRYLRTLEPGLNVIIPVLDQVRFRFDLRETPMEVPAQVCITKDNTQVSVDGIMYIQITDAKLAAYGSSNPIMAVVQLAQTAMRSEIGRLHLDESLSSRQQLNLAVVSVLDEAGATWGIKVLRYEIKDITPPNEILRAMELQITADRERRATIARSEGERQQQINVSEGQRQQSINVAEGLKQSEILKAEGQSQAIQLVAQATAQAIATIGQATVQPGGIEALQLQVARDFIAQWGNLAKQSTTVLIPAEMGNVGSFIATALEIIRSRTGESTPLPQPPVLPKNAPR